MRIILSFFISGVVLGWSLCVLSCGILIFPSVGNISSNWKEGFKNGIIFGFGKSISISILSGLVSYSHFLFESFFKSEISLIIVGIFFIFYGFLFYFFPFKKIHFKKFSSLSPFLLGILYGFVPCGPNLSFLLYLSYVTKGILFGIFSGFIFSVGTLIGPVLIFSSFSPYLWKIFSKGKKYSKISGSAIYFLWGLNLILKGVKF